MAGPVLSITMPTRNRPELLARALRSLVTAMGEVAEHVEVTVSDGSDSDASERVVERLLADWPGGHRYVSNRPALTLVENMNRAAELATGEWVQQLDDDDLMMPGCGQPMIDGLRRAAPQEQVLIFGAHIVDACGVKRREQIFEHEQYLPPGDALRRLLRNSSFVREPMVVVRRAALVEAGMFGLDVGDATDTDMWVKLFSRHGARCLPVTTCAYTIHEAAATSGMWNPRTIEALGTVFDRAVASGVVPEHEVRRWQADFMHQFILAGAYRRLRARRLAEARDVLDLFRLPAVRALGRSPKWLPVRLAIAAAAGVPLWQQNMPARLRDLLPRPSCPSPRVGGRSIAERGDAGGRCRAMSDANNPAAGVRHGRPDKGAAVNTEEMSAGQVLDLRVGEIVEVRSEAEILATLDDRAELESLPFMPEMLQFCGRRFRVDKVAVKLCDTIGSTGMYRMRNAVHLEGVRCDGQAHGGCQAGCLVYWKEAWLMRVPADRHDRHEPAPEPAASGCTHETLLAATRKETSEDERFSCQATELLRAAPTRIPPWDVTQYVRDVRSGNAGVRATIRAVAIGVFNEYQDFSRRFLPRPLRIKGGIRFPFIQGRLEGTPDDRLDLHPGDLVRIRSKEEIVSTLDGNNSNRGLSFDPEMLWFCGQQARVLRRVERTIDERTGKLLHLKRACITLEGVTCRGEFHRCCPRADFPYWREAWLERVE